MIATDIITYLLHNKSIFHSEKCGHVHTVASSACKWEPHAAAALEPHAALRTSRAQAEGIEGSIPSEAGIDAEPHATPKRMTYVADWSMRLL